MVVRFKIIILNCTHLKGSMKNKKLIVLFSILVFLTVLVVLSSTLFTLQTVNIKWHTEKYKMSNFKDYDIADSVSLGGSIFLVDKDEMSSKIQSWANSITFNQGV